jgi:hypothetical protein
MPEPPESSDAEWRTVGLQNALQRIRQNEEEQTKRRREGRKRGQLTRSPVERLRNCNPGQLRAALRICRQFLKDHRTAPDEYDCAQKYRRTVLLSVPAGKMRYQLEKRPCGKGCNQCPHRPYLYADYRDGSIIKQKYFGKPPFGKIPRKVRAAIRNRAEV